MSDSLSWQTDMPNRHSHTSVQSGGTSSFAVRSVLVTAWLAVTALLVYMAPTFVSSWARGAVVIWSFFAVPTALVTLVWQWLNGGPTAWLLVALTSWCGAAGTSSALIHDGHPAHSSTLETFLLVLASALCATNIGAALRRPGRPAGELDAFPSNSPKNSSSGKG